MNQRLILSLIVVAVLAALVGAATYLNPKTARQLEAEAISEPVKSWRMVTIGQASFTAEVAATQEEQSLGLAGRDSIPEGTGMLFPFSPRERVSFWMKDMRFALDIVWIAQGRVIGIAKDVPPPDPGTLDQDLPTYAPPSEVDHVLEIRAGESGSFAVGDEVTFTNLESA
jgi:uncharacterized protein